jgi:hypothetical protein
MGLVLNFPTNLEDRFHLALRDRNNRCTLPHTPWLGEDIGEQYGDIETRGINMYFNLHQKEYNAFFHWLDDTSKIMGIPFKFRYVTTKREAYVGHDEHNFFSHLWLKLY